MFQAGQILVDSWGYSMTFVDFYIVERATEKSVWIRSIGSKQAPYNGERGYGTGYVIPDLTLPHGELMHRRVSGSFVRGRHSSARAGLWGGQPMYTNHND